MITTNAKKLKKQQEISPKQLKREKKYREQINFLIFLFVLIEPFLYFLTQIGNPPTYFINLKTVLEYAFLLTIIFTTTIVYKRRKVIPYYILVALYCFLHLMSITTTPQINRIREINELLQTFFLPTLLISLYTIREEIKISQNLLLTTTILYILLFYLTDIYHLIPLENGERNIEFFSQVVGLFTVIAPIFLLEIIQEKDKIKKTIKMIIGIILILLLNSRMIYLSVASILLSVTLWHFLKKNQKSKRSTILSLAIAVLIFTLPLLLFPKNMSWMKEETNDLEQVEKEESKKVNEEDPKIQNNETIEWNNPQEILFGNHTRENTTTKSKTKDYLLSLQQEGIIGFFLILLPYGFFLVQMIKKQNEKYKPHQYENPKILLPKMSTYFSIVLLVVLGKSLGITPLGWMTTCLFLFSIPKSKTTLLFTAHSLDIGGIEKALLTLLNKIDYEKYEVDVILEQKKGIWINKVNPKVTVIEQKVSNHPNPILRKMTNFLRQTKFRIQKGKTYDFSCCYATYSLSGNVIARMASCNSTIFIHNNYKDLYQDEQQERKFYDDRKLEQFRKIIFVSNESAKDFLRLYQQLAPKVMVLNNFIDVEEIKEKSKEQIPIQKQSNQTIFVFVGRLQQHSKKIERAIHTVGNLKNTILLLVGDGEDRAFYENLVKKEKLEDKIQFLGKQSNPYPYMKLADYIILTSDYEGFPVIYLEALVLNKKIITTIPTSDDKISIDTKTAFIVSKEENKLQEEIKQILKSNKELETIDMEKVQENRMKDYEKLFDEVITIE